MEYRPIEVNIICARNLKDVNVFSTMDVYVICSVSGDPRSTQKTPVDKGGGTNPNWNFLMKFAFDEPAARVNRLGLVFQITSDRTLGDKEIGRVYVPLKELFDSVELAGKHGFSGDISGDEKRVTYQVQTPTGKFKGHLEFTFKFGEKFNHTVDRRFDDPVMGYPPPGPGSHMGQNVPASSPYQVQGGPGPYPVRPGSGYPQTGCGNGCGYPGRVPSRYGYSGQGPNGNGYTGMKGNEGSGMGVGMGVGSGLLGGLLVGEMIEDMSTSNEMMDVGGGGMFDF